MIQIIVRAKTGLHAGATWQFDQTSVKLGASAKADVFLCDPDVPDDLLILKRSGRKVTLESRHPQCQIIGHDNKIVEDVLFAGQSSVLTYRHIQLEIHVVRSVSGPLMQLADRFSQLGHVLLRGLRNLGARAIVAALFLISMAMTTLVMFFGTAGVAKSEAKPHAQSQQSEKGNNPLEAAVKSLPEQMAKLAADEMITFTSTHHIETMMVSNQGVKLNIEGELSRKQTQLFEKAITRIHRDYGDQVQIHAEIRLTDEQQKVDQFDVEQVMLGQRPVVILRDGTRLYVGGIYDGLSVVQISADRVVLKGETTYEVAL